MTDEELRRLERLAAENPTDPTARLAWLRGLALLTRWAALWSDLGLWRPYVYHGSEPMGISSLRLKGLLEGLTLHPHFELAIARKPVGESSNFGPNATNLELREGFD